MKELEKLKQSILAEYPRLTEDDTFKFACRPGVSCFNECCGDVNIFLTPYDILRLKNRLKISSQEFLDRYTITPIDKNQQYPVVLLRMGDNAKKKCYFVSPEGCMLYEDRPWACRIYPLGMASPREGDVDVEEEFYFILREDICRGFEEDREWKVSEWKLDQRMEKYDEFGNMFKEITLHDYFKRGKQLDPPKMEMFHMVCYNIDKFRQFIKQTTFLKRFVLKDVSVDKLMEDDEELLKFGFRWLKFALFGEKTMKVRPAALRE